MAETANTKEDISVSPKEAAEEESAEMWQQQQHSSASYQNAPPHYRYHQPQHHQHQQQPPSYVHHQHYQRQHEGYQSQEIQPPHANRHASYDHHPSYNEHPNPPPHHSHSYQHDTNQQQQHYYHQHQEHKPPRHPPTHVNEMSQASYHCEPAGHCQAPPPQVLSVASSHRAISSSWSETSSMSHSSSNPSYAHAARSRDRGSPPTRGEKSYPQHRPEHHDQTSAQYEGRRDRHISEDGRMEWNGSEWVPRTTRHHRQQPPPHPSQQQYYAHYETSQPPSESFSSAERKRVTMSHENRSRALPPVFQPPTEDQQQHSADVHSKMKPEYKSPTNREEQVRNTGYDTMKKQRVESENHRPSVVIIDDDDNGQKLSERKETVSTSPKMSSVSPSSSSSRRNENKSTAPKHQSQSNQLHHQQMDEEKESHSDAKSPIVMEYLARAKERESEKQSGFSGRKQREEPTPQCLSEKKHEESKGTQPEVTTTDRSEKKQLLQLPPPSSMFAGVVGSLKKHETSSLSSTKARMADSHRTKRLLMSFFGHGSSSTKENHTQQMKAVKRTRLVSEPSSPETVGLPHEEKQRYVLKFNTQGNTKEKKNTYNRIEEHSTRPTFSSSRGRFLHNQIQDNSTSDRLACPKKQTSAYIYSYNANVQKSDPFFSSCSEVKHLSHPSPIADMTLTLAKKGSDGNDDESDEGATGSATESSTSGAVSEESSTASEPLSSSSDYSEESVVEYRSKNKTKKRKRISQPRSSRQQQPPPTNQTSVPRLQPAPPVLEGRGVDNDAPVGVNTAASRQKQDKHKRPKMRHRRQVSPTQPPNKLIGGTSESLQEVERKNKNIGGAKLGNVLVSNKKKSEIILESSAVHANAAAEKKNPVDKAVTENHTASEHQASSSSTPSGELRNKKPTKPVMLAPPKKSSASKSKVTQRKRQLPTRENWSERRLPHTLQGTDVRGEVHAGASKSGSSRFSAKDMSTSSSLSIKDTSSKCLSKTDDCIARLKNSYDANEPKVAMKSLERSASAESHPSGPKRSGEPKVQDNRLKKRRSSSIEITPDAYGGNKKPNKEDGGPQDKKKKDGNRLASGRETDKLPHQPKKISLEEATVPNKKQRPINEKKNVVASKAFKATKTTAEEVGGNDAVIPSLHKKGEKGSETSSTSKTEDKQNAVSCTSDRKKKQDSLVKVPCTEINWSDMGKEDDIVDDNAINDTPQWKDWNTDNPICKELKDKEGRKAHAQRKRVTEYECEVCRKRTFLVFDECVAHEEECLAEQQKSAALETKRSSGKDQSTEKSARKKSTEHKDKSVVKSNDVLQEVKTEDLVSLLMQQLVHCGKNNKGSAGMAGNTMMCKHCKNAKFPKTSSTKRLGKWKRKRKVVNHLLNCPNGADETKHTIEKIWKQEVASREKSLGSLDLQAKAPSATPVASALKSDRKEPPIEETKPADNRVLNNATFVRSESGGWSCRQCRMLPLSLRAEGAVLHGLPSESCIENHLKICCRNRPVLGAAKDAILGMTDTISKMRFDTLIEPDFKAIVRILVGGIEELVTTFTDAIRAEWFGSDDESFKIPGDGSWEKFPAETIDEEAAIDAMATFARSGIGFDFVSNESFVRYVDIIAPGYKLPTEDDLMACW